MCNYVQIYKIMKTWCYIAVLSVSSGEISLQNIQQRFLAAHFLILRKTRLQLAYKWCYFLFVNVCEKVVCSPAAQMRWPKRAPLVHEERLLTPRWFVASGVVGSTSAGRGRSLYFLHPGNPFGPALQEFLALRLLFPPEKPLSGFEGFTPQPRPSSTQLCRGNWHKASELPGQNQIIWKWSAGN